jgi:cytochrome c-type biogenesis protein CcmH/NrfG
MPDESKKNLVKRVFIVAAGLAFLGTMSFPLIGSLFNSPASSNQQTANTPVDNQELQQLASGYEEVLKREPNNVSALQKLAEVRIAIQDFQGAVEPVKKLMELDPENPQYLVVLLQLYQKTNNIEGAKELKGKVETLASTEPDNPQFIQLLTQLYQQTDDLASARSLTEKVEKLAESQPENTQLLLILVQLYQQTGNKEGARGLMQKVKVLGESQPENVQYLQLLAQLQLQTEDLTGAIETMKKIQGIYPEDEKIKTAIEKLEQEVAKRQQIPTPSLPDLSVPESPSAQP